MLIPFPLGLLATAVIFDIIQLITGKGIFSKTAFYMIAIRTPRTEKGHRSLKAVTL